MYLVMQSRRILTFERLFEHILDPWNTSPPIAREPIRGTLHVHFSRACATTYRGTGSYQCRGGTPFRYTMTKELLTSLHKFRS
ncbi:hypothetical protein Sjap_015404 [Stephania japonica]|uniref:Uncharacterized protein n=1 Tax=Stephania japonica TaxID=461633 RepID=A0AAP0IJB7_9MAGN